MTDFDRMLSDTFQRVAQPGDPTGVADLIRSRVEAGDTGIPSDSAVFGNKTWSWLPWVGAGVVVAVVGGVAGITGLFGEGAFGAATQAGAPEQAPGVGVVETTNGLDCPGGRPVVAFHAGDRVLAVARSDDSAYLAVRSPADRSNTVWLPVEAVAVDADQQSIEELEVDGCPVPTIEVTAPEQKPGPDAEPAPQPDSPVEPAPGPAPEPVTPPAPDNPPTLGTPSASSSLIYTGGSSIISVTAADDKGVNSVAVQWSGADSGSAQMVKSGSTWTFEYQESGQYGDVTFSVRASDTAGQLSPSKSVTIEVQYFG